ncbi:hypothetical protein EAF04_000456 [Stromatinia cepivora]|nr:hypothetical protein EAF04_000456 [Stromatinia cepivora]
MIQYNWILFVKVNVFKFVIFVNNIWSSVFVFIVNDVKYNVNIDTKYNFYINCFFLVNQYQSLGLYYNIGSGIYHIVITLSYQSQNSFPSTLYFLITLLYYVFLIFFSSIQDIDLDGYIEDSVYSEESDMNRNPLWEVYLYRLEDQLCLRVFYILNQQIINLLKFQWKSLLYLIFIDNGAAGYSFINRKVGDRFVLYYYFIHCGSYDSWTPMASYYCSIGFIVIIIPDVVYNRKATLQINSKVAKTDLILPLWKLVLQLVVVFEFAFDFDSNRISDIGENLDDPDIEVSFSLNSYYICYINNTANTRVKMIPNWPILKSVSVQIVTGFRLYRQLLRNPNILFLFVRPKINNIKYLIANSFVQFCKDKKIYIIKVFWDKLDLVYELYYIVIIDAIHIYYNIVDSDIEKFIKKIERFISIVKEIQYKLPL